MGVLFCVFVATMKVRQALKNMALKHHKTCELYTKETHVPHVELQENVCTM